MIKNNLLVLACLITSFMMMPTISNALPAGQNQLRLQTGAPKRSGETAFSYMVTWRKRDSNLHRANGLTFLNGSGTKNPTTDIEVARKISNALNASIDYDAPSERGAIAKNSKEKAEIVVSNKSGFDLANITVRDYSNQALHFDIPGKNFKAASVDLAIDLVYSAAVEYVDGFSSGIQQKAEGGFVRVKIDNNAAIEIKTDDKSTKQIEKEIAQAIGLGTQFSSTSIYPNFVERKSRNYKAFDGGEVQLPGLNAKSIVIDIDDAGLGVLTKFAFPDENKPTDVAGNIYYIVALLIAGAIGFAFYTGQFKTANEDQG